MKNLEILNINDLKKLAQWRYPPCVSIYIPLRNGLPESQQGPVMLLDYLKQAKMILGNNPSKAGGKIPDLLKPAYELCDDHFFWKNSAAGLALLIAPNLFARYRLPVRFPGSLYVARYFDLRPLLPLLSGNQIYYLLELKKEKARLFYGSRYEISEIRNTGFPKDAKSLFHQSKEKEIESHGMGTLSQRNIFHGQGGLKDAQEALERRFFQSVDRQIRKLLILDNIPLFLIASDKALSNYEEVNKYQKLVKIKKQINMDTPNEEILANKIWESASPYLEGDISNALREYRDQYGSDNPDKIIQAAANGRIKYLFCLKYIYPRETISQKYGKRATTGNEEQAAQAVLETFLHKGTVYMLDKSLMPGRSTLAAVFRY